MKKIFLKNTSIFLIIFTFIAVSSIYSYADTVHTVVSGDSMWKIAVRYEIGISEIISANPHIKNPALIYPGDKITVPQINDVKSIEDEVIRLVNIERSKNGLAPLSKNWELSRVARYKSQDMINKNYFSHTSPTYGSPFDMMKNFGIKYSTAGENIAYGQKTAQEVMNAWMNSSGHRKNILSPNYTQIGVGLATNSSGVRYWTQMFIRP